MKSLTFTAQKTRYDDSNAEIALLTLLEPERYEGALLEWAQLVAYRLATENPGQYPELEKAWAKVAYQMAFKQEQPGRAETTEEELQELTELSPWHRR